MADGLLADRLTWIKVITFFCKHKKDSNKERNNERNNERKNETYNKDRYNDVKHFLVQKLMLNQ